MAITTGSFTGNESMHEANINHDSLPYSRWPYIKKNNLRFFFLLNQDINIVLKCTVYYSDKYSKEKGIYRAKI